MFFRVFQRHFPAILLCIRASLNLVVVLLLFG